MAAVDVAHLGVLRLPPSIDYLVLNSVVFIIVFISCNAVKGSSASTVDDTSEHFQ